MCALLLIKVYFKPCSLLFIPPSPLIPIYHQPSRIENVLITCKYSDVPFSQTLSQLLYNSLRSIFRTFVEHYVVYLCAKYITITFFDLVSSFLHHYSHPISYMPPTVSRECFCYTCFISFFLRALSITNKVLVGAALIGLLFFGAAS